MPNILSWEDLSDLQSNDIDRVNGITNSYSNLRLFGHKESDAKLIFYRDRHCLLYTSPSPRDSDTSRMPSSA